MARRQLLLAGVDRHAIDRRLKTGRLALVHPGIYGMPGTSELPLAPETAAVLACGDGAALSHHSAMTLWVMSGNARARRFYQRLGFAPDGAARTNTQLIGSPFDEIRYRMVIA